MGSHFDKGVLLYKLKNYKQAEKELREELVSAPQSASAHAMLGMTLNVLRKTKQAHNEAMESARLAPYYAYAHYTLSYTFAQQNKLKEAEKSITEALRLNPTEAYLFTRAAQLQALMRNHEKALEFAERGVACDPEDDACQVQRATALLELGRLKQADESLNAALSVNAENQVAHLRKGDVQLRLGNKNSAFEHYREALRLKPDDAAARVGAISALKSRNWLYYLLLMLTIKVRRLPAPMVVALVILLIVPHMRVLICIIFFAAVIIGQCHIFLLRFDKQFKALLTKDEIHNNNFYVFFISMVLVTLGCLEVFDKEHSPFSKPHFQDYPSYMSYIEKRIKEKWSPQGMDRSGKTVLQFYLDSDGDVSNIKVKQSSGDIQCDNAAIDALNTAAPLPALPKPETHPVPVEFTFDYRVHQPGEKNSAQTNSAPANSTQKISPQEKSVQENSPQANSPQENSAQHIMDAQK